MPMGYNPAFLHFFEHTQVPVFTTPDWLLLAVISYALYTDLKTGLIYNHLTFPAMLAGGLLAYALRGTPGLADAAAGTALGFALLYVPYAVGWQGAGDVKLLMAVGALQGWRFVLVAFAFYLAASFLLSVIYISAKIVGRGREGREFLARIGIAVAFGLAVNTPADNELLKTDVKWSPALFAGTFVALIYMRSFI